VTAAGMAATVAMALTAAAAATILGYNTALAAAPRAEPPEAEVTEVAEVAAATSLGDAQRIGEHP
jgi:hypothetical protein